MDWQGIVAGIIVALAALWLLRRMWRTVQRGLRGDASSAACSSCPKSSSPLRREQGSVVQLDRKKQQG